LNIPYDYGSIMHYGKRAFSNNGRDTIVPKKAGVSTFIEHTSRMLFIYKRWSFKAHSQLFFKQPFAN
jgi:hypothetical protein